MAKPKRQSPCSQSRNPKLDPADAVIAANRAAIDVHLTRYAMNEKWERLAELAGQEAYPKIQKAIAAFGQDPANQSDPGWLSDLAKRLAHLREIAPVRAEAYPKTQLITDLIGIWHQAGHRMGASQSGPTARYLGKLLPWSCDDKTIQRYIQQERRNRPYKGHIDENKIWILRDGKVV